MGYSSIQKEELEDNLMKFFADDMVGKLARYLRLSGYDCAYEKSIPDDELVRRAVNEDRLIVTRDTRLKERYPEAPVYVLSSEDPREQLFRLRNALGLDLRKGLFSRCLECNELIQPVDKSEVAGRVPPHVYRTRLEFWQCPGCGRVYWAGTHHERMRRRLESWLKQWEKV